MDNKPPSDHFRPAIVVARLEASAYASIAADETTYGLQAQSMPTLHHNGKKYQQLFVLKYEK
ncbi:MULTISPECIES: hypothetical protein [Halomonadaceae]|uniref:Reverse transcriptase/retrotransposon-derived protein RNase H-like domain-containing protein n=1 Tax=Vreelandella piezotolerans TaxID=2609667 RepID=A0ABQ6X8Z5_9GAMM|nr:MULTISPECIES: hypothetical protein [Halomonas]KAE8438488.1 hypothetical protein F1978_09110 [Halomonas piezotolerans]MCG7576982.1 hypothetical protein [Halomonas sp. MMH1-48]MCG7604045.1 hypothetical protein [Halomonas sp. MM17-34]MCG7613147.1 hypothetical protein [Halomonas sp. MM17-29]MCG7619922.1 hypothetical protein [Halomonas sp. DSH1-27]